MVKNLPTNVGGCVCCVLSPILCDPMDCVAPHQALLSMGFPRQECWSGLPSPPPDDLPDLGIKLESQARDVGGGNWPVLRGRGAEGRGARRLGAQRAPRPGARWPLTAPSPWRTTTATRAPVKKKNKK